MKWNIVIKLIYLNLIEFLRIAVRSIIPVKNSYKMSDTNVVSK